MPTEQASLGFLNDPSLTEVDPQVIQDMNAAMIARGDGPASPYPGTLQPHQSQFPSANRFNFTPQQMQEMANSIDQAAQQTTAETTPPVNPDPAPGAPSAEPPTPDPSAPVTPDAPKPDTPPATPPATPSADQAIPPVTPEPSTDSFKVKMGDQEVDLNTQQITYLLSLNQWLEDVPAETKQAWAQIQQGTHTVIPQDELTQFKAWQALGSPKAEDAKPDLSDLAPEQAEYIRRLEAIAAPALNPEPPAPATPPVSVQAQQLAEQQIRMQQDLTAVITEFSTKYSLTPEQIDHLQAATTRSGIVAQIDNQSRVYSPTGQLISRAPFGEVLRKAFDVTMATDDTLRTVRDDALYNERQAAENAANQQTNGKKAAAGSLSALAPAAVTSGAPQTGPQTPQAMMAGIATMLREAEANGTISQ